MSTSTLIGIPDLLLSSRVNALAREIGVPVLATFTKHDLLSKAHGENPSLLIIDLDAEQLLPLDSVRALREDTHTRSMRIVGFLPKPDVQGRQKAEAAGCDLVMSRTQLLEALPEILNGAILKEPK